MRICTVSKHVRTHIYALCAHVFRWNFTKIVLIVHDYFKFEREQASKISWGMLLLCGVSSASIGGCKPDTVRRSQGPHQSEFRSRDWNSGFWLIRLLVPARDVHIQAANQRPSWLRTAETSLQKLGFVFGSFACVCAQIFAKIFILFLFSVMSLSFKFHQDPIFRCGDICKIELYLFMASTVGVAKSSRKCLNGKIWMTELNNFVSIYQKMEKWRNYFNYRKRRKWRNEEKLG